MMRPAAIALMIAVPAMAQVQQLWESPAPSISQIEGLDALKSQWNIPQ